MSVWPSGAALAAASAPIEPPAPGRLSITTNCARFGELLAERAREDIGRAARREGHDQADRARGVRLRERRGQRGKQNEGEAGAAKGLHVRRNPIRSDR
jgi:hypothetical protein